MYPPLLSPESLKAVTRERLRLLSLGYYISGVICILMASIFIFHVVFLTIFSFIPPEQWEKPKSASQEHVLEGSEPEQKSASAPARSKESPVVFFRVMAGVLFLLMLCGWTLGGFTIYAGRCIAKRKKRTLILIVAGINCLFIPYGTILGVCTFLGLGSEAAREEWELAGFE